MFFFLFLAIVPLSLMHQFVISSVTLVLHTYSITDITVIYTVIKMKVEENSHGIRMQTIAFLCRSFPSSNLPNVLRVLSCFLNVSSLPSVC